MPTGYGKSLIFQLLPDVYDLYFGVENSIVLVISPLNALMQDQVAKLKERGISACMIQGHGVVAGEGKDDLNLKLPLGELANPTFQLVYMHPEVCVDDKKVIGFLNSAVYQERVRCVVVDEAHLVLNWNSFRPAYGKLDVLVSIFPEIPHLATTATATLKSQKEICDRLQIIDPVVISVNPDRSNIFLE